MTDDLLATRSSVRAVDGYLPRRTGALLGAQIAGQGLAVVTSVLLTRRLGVSGFGVYAFVTAAVFVANVGTTFGTDMVLIREIAADHRRDLRPGRCAAALVLQIILSAFVIAVLLVGSAVVSALGPSRADRFVAPLRIFSLSLLPAAVFSVGTAVLRGLGMLRAYAVAVVAAAGLPLTAVAVFIRSGATLVRTTTVLLGAQVAVALVAVIACVVPVTRTRVSLRPTRAELVDIARASRAVGGLGLVGVLYQRIAMLGVAVLVGPTANGWYSGAARIVEASKTGHIALAAATYPVMADHQDRSAVLGRARRTNVMMAIAVAVVLIIGGRVLIERLYGPAFGESKPALTILALGLVASCVATFETLAMLAEHREREVLRVMGVSLVVLLVGLVAMVTAVGWIGACWAMLVADVTQSALLRRSRVRQ